jgi:YD repeat-containing protein
VTDPFGRFATLGYDAMGRLNAITDAAGMTSTFVYGVCDFISAMTTPYGTTTFRHEANGNRMIEATDPVGGRERLEFHVTSQIGLPRRRRPAKCRRASARRTSTCTSGTVFTGTS